MNRLVPPKSSYRRRSSAPRCRLTLARRWRSCQAFGCSPIKKVRELGSDRTEAENNFSAEVQFEPSEANYKIYVLVFSFKKKYSRTPNQSKAWYGAGQSNHGGPAFWN
ncbi:hypothetical protein A2641_00145 [Candidatus Nomurabacteria bacterium RIFCSPHIGHO2_01_FULL_37_25]|nr:MAG: hypothetical protein A2641_00145 [Candidatus Nomurabacteria bacterium RIFCSPHIGHO2_01_FULL_37_25]